MRTPKILHSSLFAALVLGVSGAAGSRALTFASPTGADWLDGRLAKAFEAHYDAVFPARTFGTNLWAAIEYTLFREGRPGVVVGTQGWLYTDEEFKAHAGAEATVATHLALIPWVRDELARQGSTLVVALVPSKARVYPEFTGGRVPATVHGNLYARAQAALRDAGIPAPDLERELSACKQQAPSFMRTDTHWSPAGARCAARALAGAGAAMPAPAPRAAHAAWRTEEGAIEPYRGDLVQFLPLAPYFASLLPPAEPLPAHVTAREGDGADALLAETPAPQVVLVGTSYSADARWNLAGALQQALQQDVVNYASRGRGPFLPMLEYLLDSQGLPAAPRVVIWEIPERYLPVAQDLRAERSGGECEALPDGRTT